MTGATSAFLLPSASALVKNAETDGFVAYDKILGFGMGVAGFARVVAW